MSSRRVYVLVNPRSKQRIRINFTIDREIVSRLRYQSGREGRPMSRIAEESLTAYLSVHKGEVGEPREGGEGLLPKSVLEKLRSLGVNLNKLD